MCAGHEAAETSIIQNKCRKSFGGGQCLKPSHSISVSDNMGKQWTPYWYCVDVDSEDLPISLSLSLYYTHTHTHTNTHTCTLTVTTRGDKTFITFT